MFTTSGSETWSRTRFRTLDLKENCQISHMHRIWSHVDALIWLPKDSQLTLSTLRHHSTDQLSWYKHLQDSVPFGLWTSSCWWHSHWVVSQTCVSILKLRTLPSVVYSAQSYSAIVASRLQNSPFASQNPSMSFGSTVSSHHALTSFASSGTGTGTVSISISGCSRILGGGVWGPFTDEGAGFSSAPLFILAVWRPCFDVAKLPSILNSLGSCRAVWRRSRWYISSCCLPSEFPPPVLGFHSTSMNALNASRCHGPFSCSSETTEQTPLDAFVRTILERFHGPAWFQLCHLSMHDFEVHCLNHLRQLAVTLSCPSVGPTHCDHHHFSQIHWARTATRQNDALAVNTVSKFLLKHTCGSREALDPSHSILDRTTSLIRVCRTFPPSSSHCVWPEPRQRLPGWKVRCPSWAVRTTPQRTRFSRCGKCKNNGYSLIWRWQDEVGLQHQQENLELCMCGETERWDVRHQWQRENQDQHRAHEILHSTWWRSERSRSLLLVLFC